MDTIAFGALESAEFVTCRTGRNAAQYRASLAMRTARTLYEAKRRTGGCCMRVGHVRHPFKSGGCTTRGPTPATDW
jgi:hypothetical protein